MPAELDGNQLATANAGAAAWCAVVNAAVHSEICAVPAGRLETERALLEDAELRGTVRAKLSS